MCSLVCHISLATQPSSPRSPDHQLSSCRQYLPCAYEFTSRPPLPFNDSVNESVNRFSHLRPQVILHVCFAADSATSALAAVALQLLHPSALGRRVRDPAEFLSVEDVLGWLSECIDAGCILTGNGQWMAGPPAAFNALAATVGWAQATMADGGNLSPQLADNLGRARTCMATYAAQLFVERGRSGGGGDGGNGKGTRGQAALAAAAATADARVAATACDVLCALAVLSDDACLAAAEWDAAPCIVAILKLFGGILHVSTATACELLEQATEALPALIAAHSKSREAISGGGGGGSADIAAAAAQLLPRLQPASRRRLTPSSAAGDRCITARGLPAGR